ncbi:4Fe-4S binding protein [Gelria sp. Kuro-4]|uniref:4Fe-4S binding protein n=1 Tax=Gelria sp. Kuro-4 TaxID=2796927 RepID=UPI001C815A4D
MQIDEAKCIRCGVCVPYSPPEPLVSRTRKRRLIRTSALSAEPVAVRRLCGALPKPFTRRRTFTSGRAHSEILQ